jgi:hypothetical protein
LEPSCIGSLGGLTPADLAKTVHIRGKTWNVQAAIQAGFPHGPARGQIVYLAKHAAARAWSTLSVPRAQSAQYNRMIQEQARAGGPDALSRARA